MVKKQDNKVTQLGERVADLENQLKRAVADYRNLEQRVSDGRSELTSFVGAELIKRLLPVLDHLEQVTQGGRQVLSDPEPIRSEPHGRRLTEGESKDWFQGVELAVKEFKQVLQREGLEEIPAGGEFNPALQEAVDIKEGEDNKILKVVRKGYTLNGKVVRAARVVVGRKLESSSENQELREENSV